MLKSLRNGFLAGLAFVATAALAQNFTSAVQLSQDPRGPLPLDTAQNVYLTNNRHFNQQPGASPGPTITGTGCTATANSTDLSGQMTGCSGATGTVTFGQAFVTAPRCLATTSNATNVALTVSSTTTALTITPNTAGAGTWNWWCPSVS